MKGVVLWQSRRGMPIHTHGVWLIGEADKFLRPKGVLPDRPLAEAGITGGGMQSITPPRFG
ncbi:MAG: hypothetical protein AAGA73_12120 [Pseudomonadota bacterium]